MAIARLGPIGGVAAACLAVTVATWLTDPAWAFTEYDDLREGQIEAGAAIVLTVTGAVVLGRFGRQGSRSDLLLAVALLVSAAENLFVAVATPVVDAVSARPATTWTAAGASVVGAGLLVAAVVLPDPVVARGRRQVAAMAVAGGGLVLGAIAVACHLLDGSLPRAFATTPTTVAELGREPLHAALVAVEVGLAGAWATVAVLCGIRARRRGDALLGALSLGATFEAASSVNYVLFPSRFTEILYLGDLFVVVAIGVLLHGAIREVTSAESAVVRSAVSDERARVADELQAGVMQELALMAVQSDWMARQPPDQRRLDELSAAAERALDESRGVMAALVEPADAPLATALAEATGRTATRLGVRVEHRLDPHVRVAPEWRAALVRCARDAVTAAVRDRGAAHLVVELEGGRRVVLRVTDDGVARPDATDDDPGPGAAALQERVAQLGATFREERSATGATTIEVELPPAREIRVP